MLDGMPTGKHYSGNQGAEYFRYQSLYRATRARLNAAKFRGHIGATDTVVDFGCGEALMLDLLPGAVKIGVEPNEHARAAAVERGARVIASASELGPASVDVVISNHALEHTLSPWAELRELHRVLRPGGKLVVWLPLDDWRGQRAAESEDPNHHLYTWTPLLLRNLVVEAGFLVEDVGVHARAWPPRFVEQAARLPTSVFDAVCRVVALAMRRRQLYVVARVPSE